MVTTSNLDAILWTYLYSKVVIVVLIFKFKWHLEFLFEKSDNSTQTQGSLGGHISWPTPTNTASAPAAACREGRPEQQAGDLPARQRDFSPGQASIPPARTAGDSNEMVPGCITLREEGDGRYPSRPSSSGPHSPAPSPSLPTALLLRNPTQPGPIHSLREFPRRGQGAMVDQPWPPALSNPPPLLRRLLNESDLSKHFFLMFNL